MNPVDVVEVESPDQLDQFIKYPYRLYKGEKNFVAPLLIERKEFFDLERNPFYRGARVKFFLAYRDGSLVGRVATCINYRHNNFHEEKTGFFGFFDTADDQEAASMLLKVAMITLKKEGMDRMRGPMNFSTNHECGMLVEGFDSPPVVMMTYNYPYQVKLAENFGLKKVMDLLALQMSKQTGTVERFDRVVGKLRARTGVKIRSLNMSAFERDLRLVQQVYNEAWQHNWGFVPMDDAEFSYMARNLKQVIDPNLVLLAEAGDRPVGFCLALPDINQALIRLNGRLFPFGMLKLLWHTKVRSKINRVRLVTFGVVPDFQRKGVDSLLFMDVFNSGTSRGYHNAELSWILETNEMMLKLAADMGATPYKRYRVLEMPL